MKVKLVRDARIRHKAGEIVEISPDEARSLISLGSAVPVPAEPSAGKKAPPKKERK